MRGTGGSDFFIGISVSAAREWHLELLCLQKRPTGRINGMRPCPRIQSGACRGRIDIVFGFMETGPNVYSMSG
ncbi:hypothetical protein NDU88_001922 [Pleurodeles waltl]|uniref:Uncharacterized protein n=1 Tax=Pleurodeles waltl TaxID=8319 RepID=A0AAV7ML60_PLEWA|nr:hypothetical protein NDU88_001922 [Pleurodeles waltl]